LLQICDITAESGFRGSPTGSSIRKHSNSLNDDCYCYVSSTLSQLPPPNAFIKICLSGECSSGSR
jgi:hypothetical protein